MKIAVYGTLRKGYSNNKLMIGSTFERMALTKPEYTMFAAGIPYVVEGGRDSITVEVYEVPLEFLPSIDALEGHPWMYKRSLIELEDGSEVSLYLYQVGDRVLDGNFETYMKEESNGTA